MENIVRVVMSILVVCTVVTVGNAQQTASTEERVIYPSLRSAMLSDTIALRQNKMYIPAEHRALFCRFDDKLDKEKIPLRMRLGSLEEVNRKEAKPGYRLGTVAPKEP